jgi:hypothetical protein
LLVPLLLLPVVACSDDGGDAKEPDSTTSTTDKDRPDGPAADLSTELTGGKGVFVATASPDDVDKVGYTEHEYAATGTAVSYTAEGELTADGTWTFAPGPEAAYATRVLVRQPADDDDFSGTVIMEWLNVSAGADAEPEWSNLREEIVRSGDVWVGVSAQAIGVEGGPVAVAVTGVPGAEVAGQGLKKIDPARYGALSNPGDAYAFDIYTQVARAIRQGNGIGDLHPAHVLAAGQSQSAFAMTTYLNGVQPLTEAFDGFFVHSRGAPGLPLAAPGQAVDIASSLAAPPTTLRDDLGVPIMNIQTESDVAGIFASAKVRQDDTDTFRLWEIAGTAHADQYTVGDSAKYIDCGVPINDGPTHVVAKAAYHALTAWVADGTLPPEAPRLEVPDVANPEIKRDADGIALGGIRTPPVDVPVATLSSTPGPTQSTICLLLGSTTPFTAERIAQLYDDADDYTAKYDASTDATIEAGFALDADKDALLDFADPEAVAAGVGG